MQHDTQAAQALFCVQLESSRLQADQLEPALAENGIFPAIWIDADRDAAVMECYLTVEDEALLTQALIQQCVTDLAAADRAFDGQRLLPRIRRLAARNWQEAWKQFFHTRRVSDRLIVKPPWEPAQARPRDRVIEIEPGMSFGTGLHATTQACLRFLDRLALEGGTGAFLDIGCGSGILSIAAVKLGYGPVQAIDHDPHSVSVVRENAARNGVPDMIEAETADIGAFAPKRTFDVVAANMLADILCRHAAAIAACVAPLPHARLLLAGILSSQYETVCERFAREGFVARERIETDEWTSGCFSRAPAY